ncbi:MAG: hypothetical protein K0R28_6338 [Paenibacillus sp.]|jgi:hypothetical protein|nr:hypothetical protein [Paenibacillus sp.]
MLGLQTTDPLPDLNRTELQQCRIGSMEIFRFDCEPIRIRHPGNDGDYDCGYLKISGNGMNGWGAYRLACMKRPFDLVRWASVFIRLKGLSISDAFLYIQCKEEAWGAARASLAESALKDLASKLQFPSPLERRDDLSMDGPYLIEHCKSYFSF